MPNDFRHYFSDWGHRNEDQEIVDKVAAAQNHSKEVHDRNYKHSKADEKKKITERFIKETGFDGQTIIEQTNEDEEALEKDRKTLKRKHEKGKSIFVTIDEKWKFIFKNCDDYWCSKILAEKKSKKKRTENHGRKKLEPEERRIYLKGFYKVGEVPKRLTVSKTQILAFIHKNPDRIEGAKATAKRLNKDLPQLAETISSSIRTYFRNKLIANEPTVLSESEDDDTPKDDEESEVE